MMVLEVRRALLLLCCLLCAHAEEVSLKTPLCTAVDTGKLAKVEEAFKTKVNVNEGCTILNSEFAICIAAKNSYLDIGKFLISKGADVKPAEALGYTSLLYSAENMDLPFMSLLLQHKANVTDKLINMGMGLKLGLDVLSLASATYIRSTAKPEVSDVEKGELRDTFNKIVDLLFEYCFNLKDDGQVAVSRLMSENHEDEANYINNKANQSPKNCPANQRRLFRANFMD